MSRKCHLRFKELVKAYADIAEHTRKECAGENCGCKIPFSCCSEEYCLSTIEWAKTQYDVELPVVGERLPLLGPNGCTAEPYMRPMCAVHACCINAIGVKLMGENVKAWNETYWRLRNTIDEIEGEMYEEECGAG